MVKPQEVTHVIYHGSCDDGFGAAWSAWKLLGERAQYWPAQHGEPVPELPDSSVLALVDFCYPRPVIDQLAERLRGLIILDHHVTAQADMQGLPFAVFDMDRSGAHLSWNFFHPSEPLPELLAYVEDKDLWHFRLPQSKEVTAALRSYPMEFAVWEAFRVEQLKVEGVALLRLQDQQVEAHCKRMRWETLGGHRVPVVNASDYRSEIANRLCTLHPQAAFAAAYFDTQDGHRSWSLRSVGEFNVAAVAKRWGGGGHKNASGFTEAQPVPPPPQ
jgi:oligoribonuclease NrnB/cAMP/cGMP phosphodiesterase (DHH superfamily)